MAGLTLMGERLCDPALGRFLQTDPVVGGSFNTYEYAGQDPLNKYDLNGQCWFSCVLHHVSHFAKKALAYGWGHVYVSGQACFGVCVGATFQHGWLQLSVSGLEFNYKNPAGGFRGPKGINFGFGANIGVNSATPEQQAALR